MIGTNRAMQYVLRSLGAAVGVVFVLFGALILFVDTPFGSETILRGLSVVFIGATFIRYGAVGNVRPKIHPKAITGGLVFGLGAVFVLMGFYSIFLESIPSTLSRIVAVLWVLVGLKLSRLGVVVIKQSIARGTA